MTYYNDNDRKVCEWLAALKDASLIGDETIDNRSIKDVNATELAGFTRCHFFAGIGGWDYALQLAGWPADRSVWTGSCPYQPFSCAGKGKGEADERHLWPEFRRLIAECHPATIFGEQVAKAIEYGWLDRVSADLETEGYSVGAAVLGAHSVGAPHKRQRLYWVANANSDGWSPGNKAAATVGYGDSTFTDGWPCASVGNTNRCYSHWWSGPLQVGRNVIEAKIERGGRKLRAQWRIEPGLSIVAYGIPNRVEQCNGYGNAIVPQVAATFIRAFMELKAASAATHERKL